jgi:methylenetetrahydrofolate reductase (NADPH)
VLILRLVEALRAGLEHRVGSRSACTTPFDFFPGAVVNPYKVREPDLMMQLYKLELKIAAGARFIVTQLGFDLRKLYELRQYMLREGLAHLPVLANVYVASWRGASSRTSWSAGWSRRTGARGWSARP